MACLDTTPRGEPEVDGLLSRVCQLVSKITDDELILHVFATHKRIVISAIKAYVWAWGIC